MTAPASTTTANATVEPSTTTTATATVEPSTTVAPTTEPAAVQASGDEPTQRHRRSLEDSLGPLDDDTKAFVLDAVKSARSEAKNLRDRAKSADDVRNEIASAVAKALGIEQEATDPATLAAQLTDQTSRARQAQVELAVFRAAATAGGDPAALLDSVSFVRALADVDPSDDTAIADRVRTAVAANPALGTAPVRRVPGPNPAAGSSANGAPDLETEIAAAQKAGDINRVISLQNQKLAAAAR